MADYHDVNIIGIAGPSYAGKSTAVHSLREICGFAYVPLDNFFFKKTPVGSQFGFANWEIK